MADQLLDSVRRWFEIIEVQLIDPDSFSAFEAWLHAQKVIDLTSESKDLHFPHESLHRFSEILGHFTGGARFARAGQLKTLNLDLDCQKASDLSCRSQRRDADDSGGGNRCA